MPNIPQDLLDKLKAESEKVSDAQNRLAYAMLKKVLEGNNILDAQR